MEFIAYEGKASKFQGSVGEARAIYELTKLGYVVYKPLGELSKSDLIVESQCGRLLRVQVKTSYCKRKQGSGYEVSLVTSGGRQICNSRRRIRSPGDYDMLFVLIDDGRAWLIPDEALGTVSNVIVVGTKKYEDYQL